MSNAIKISIAVLVYNGSSTIIDLLESILAQSYGPQNIELVISDDGSTDETVEKINKWLIDHAIKFYRVKFLVNSRNVGLPSNCNNAWRACSLDWIKTIAGDDILTINCIAIYAQWIKKNPNSSIVFSKMAHFTNESSKAYRVTPDNSVIKFFSDLPSKQFESLMINSFNIAPTSFIRKALLEEVGYCDDSYKLIEDLPLWLKITRAGHQLHFIDEVTVFYRVNNSISNSQKILINHKFMAELYRIKKNLVRPHLSFFQKWRILDWWIEDRSWIIPAYIFRNKKNFKSIAAHYAISVFRPVSLFRICTRIKKTIL